MGGGAFADGSKATSTVNSGSITTTGPNGSAALAKAGGTVNLNGVAVSASGDDTRPTSVDGAGVGADTGGVLNIHGGSIMVSGAGVWAVQAASGAAIHLDGTSVANTNTSITAANKLAGGVLSHGQDTRVTILNNPSISVAGSGSNTTYMTMAVKVQDGGYITLRT